MFSNGEVSAATKSSLRNELNGFKKIKDFKLVFNENNVRSLDDLSVSLQRAYADIDEKDYIINGLQREIEELKLTITNLNDRIEKSASLQDKNSVPFSAVVREAKIRYNDITSMSYASKLISKDFIKVDTVPEITVTWSGKLPDSIVVNKEKELKVWLKKQLKKDNLVLKN